MLIPQFTKPAYEDRTKRTCHALSFSDLASGSIPPDLSADPAGVVWDLIICSFALHLVPEGEMFPLCWELSTKALWLVVIAPHKKPEVSPSLCRSTSLSGCQGPKLTRTKWTSD